MSCPVPASWRSSTYAAWLPGSGTRSMTRAVAGNPLVADAKLWPPSVLTSTTGCVTGELSTSTLVTPDAQLTPRYGEIRTCVITRRIAPELSPGNAGTGEAAGRLAVVQVQPPSDDATMSSPLVAMRWSVVPVSRA